MCFVNRSTPEPHQISSRRFQMNDWLEDTKIWSFIDQTGFVANQISAPF